MKVLWVINWPFPEVSRELGTKAFLSQGWLLHIAHHLAEQNDMELSVICIANGISHMQHIEAKGINHYVIPNAGRIHKKGYYDTFLKEIVSKVEPDIIHLHGTELEHVQRAVICDFPQPAVLTIQGVMNRIGKEYLGGLSVLEALQYETIMERVKFSGMLAIKQRYLRQAQKERFVIENVKYVTGRTLWDQSIMQEINPDARYYRCNYNLRDEFYRSPKWSESKCEPYTIYTAFASYPLKGLHILLRSLALVKKKYPKVRLQVPGLDVDKQGEMIVNTGYKKYIRHLIDTLGLKENVVFLGPLGADGVIRKMLESRLVVVPSAIEGASATICEAQYLGVPCICSFRGGMTELIDNEKDGFLYDFSEYSFLASRIEQLFSDWDLCRVFSESGIAKAMQRHDPETNINAFNKLYQDILQQENRYEGENESKKQ